MAHEIMEHDVQEGRTMAWHGLTQVKPDLSLNDCWLRTWDYAAKRISIDGHKTELALLGVTDGCMVDGEDENPEVPGTKLKVPLIIGDSFNWRTFKPVLNARLLDAIATAIDGTGLTLESNGSVFNRGRTFLSFEMTAAKFTAGNRPFVPYMNIGNGNDQSSPLWINTSNTCTVCNNTFTLNMNDRGRIMSIKKTKFSDLKITEMGRAIENMLAEQKAFATLLNRLATIEVLEEKVRQFFAGFLGSENEPMASKTANAVESLVVMFKSGKGNDGKTWADAFQAGTDWYTHCAASTDDSAGAKWKNHVSSEFGSGARNKDRLWTAINNADSRNLLAKQGEKILKLTFEARQAEKAAKSQASATVTVPASVPANPPAQ